MSIFFYLKNDGEEIKQWLLGGCCASLVGGSIVFWRGTSAADTYLSAWAALNIISGLSVLALFWFWHWASNLDDDGDHLRGAKMATADQVIKQINKQKLETRLEIGSVPIPVELESRSFLFAGSPGSGKSQSMTVIFDRLQSTKIRDKAIIADASGGYYSRYAVRRDALINPFDKRSVAWSPLAEIRHVADAASLTRSMIPDGFGSSAEWNGYAQSVLQPLLEYCWQDHLTNDELFRLACVADLSELRAVLNSTAAAPMVAEGNERMFGSIRAILGSYLKAYQYLDPATGVDGFSIRNFIEEENGGWLFITYQQDQRDALKPIIQAALDISSRAVLGMHVQLDRRVWFGLDEFPLLGNIQTVVDLLTNGRKHGACALVGIQTIAQLVDTYGREKAQTILACLGTWLSLRVADHETAEYMSKAIGDEEIRRVVNSGGSTSGLNGQSSENWSEQYTTQKIVLPSELQTLPDLCGYRYAGVYMQNYEQEQAKLKRLAETSADVQKQAEKVKTIDANVKGIQLLANQNLQVQGLLVQMNDSISTANSLAAKRMEEEKLDEQRGALAASKEEAAFRAAKKQADGTTPLPTEIPLTGGKK